MKLRILIAAALVALLAGLLMQAARRRSNEAQSTPLPAVTESDGAAANSSGATAGQETAPRPKPAATATPATASRKPELASSTNWMDSLFSTNESALTLPREVFDRWLASGRTNAEDLLAARQAGGEKQFLLMALTNFPHDPRVLLAASALDDGPEAQRERLDRFKAAAPDNAMADYLSARDHFKNGRPEQAVAELLAASGKTGFNDYTIDSMQNTEELYLQAGKSPAEAKALATSSALLPQLAQFKSLAKDMAALQEKYLAAGDPASVERLAQLGWFMGERLGNSEGSRTLIGQLTGIAAQRITLGSLDQEKRYDFLQGSVTDYLTQLDQRRDAVRESTQFYEQWMRKASEQELISYFDRVKLYGEAEALKWMRQRMGPR